MAALKAGEAECELLVGIAELDDWVRKAAPGEWLTYQRGPYLLHGDLSRRVRDHILAGLVDPAQPASADRPGCRDFKIQRRSQRRPAAPAQAARADTEDAPMAAILTELKRCANLGARCPSDLDLARKAGLATKAQAAWRFRKLVQSGAIRSDALPAGPETGFGLRVVTIVETGRRSWAPKGWARLRADIAAEDER